MLARVKTKKLRYFSYVGAKLSTKGQSRKSIPGSRKRGRPKTTRLNITELIEMTPAVKGYAHCWVHTEVHSEAPRAT